MMKIGREHGTFLDRVYYQDDNGDVICEIQAKDVRDTIAYNKEAAGNHRKHNGDEVRVTAEIPVALYYQWIVESGLPGWATPEQQEYITKKLQDPAYKYVCTVPENYQHMTR